MTPEWLLDLGRIVYQIMFGIADLLSGFLGSSAEAAFGLVLVVFFLWIILT